MTYPIDQTTDPGFAYLTGLVTTYPELRGIAKHAELSPSEFDGLADSQFAWPEARRFPIHDRGHVALSLGYTKIAKEKVPKEVIDVLTKAAALHSLDENTIFPAQEKVAEDSGYYLLPERQRFRVSQAADIPRVERAYHEKYAQMTADEKAEAGVRLVAIAGQYQVPLSSQTQKLAGFTATQVQKAADWVEARKEAALKVNSPIADSFTILADGIRKLGSAILVDHMTQIKLTKTLSTLDKEAGITPFYAHYLPDPMQTIFNTDKKASSLVKVGSVVYDKAMLSQVPLTFWQDALGPDITQEIAPNGVVDVEMLSALLPTLPADIKSMLDTQLAPYNG